LYWDRFPQKEEQARQLLEPWPPDHPKPAPAYLWRMLGKAVERGELKREGVGIKADPHRYGLAALEEKGQHDPAARLEQTMLDSKREGMSRRRRWRTARCPGRASARPRSRRKYRRRSWPGWG